MAVLIEIEGIDGSGKGTQAANLARHLSESGISAAKISFPRYETTRFGRVIGQFLNGAFGSLDEVHPQLAALLFAGDRFESREDLLSLSAEHQVVVLDRYVASNAAHQAAKLDGAARSELIEFINELEFGIYNLPEPDRVLWLDVTVDWSQRLIRRKAERSYTDREADLQEEDTDYLARVRSVYAELAKEGENWTRIDCCPNDDLLSEKQVFESIVREVTPLVESATAERP